MQGGVASNLAPLLLCGIAAALLGVAAGALLL